MMDTADTRFFLTLNTVCAEIEDVTQTCRDSVARAARTGDPLDRQNARQAINALEDRVRDRVLAQVHRHMAMDMSAVWDNLPTAPKGTPPN